MERLGEVEGEETVIRMYYMREGFIFNKKMQHNTNGIVSCHLWQQK